MKKKQDSKKGLRFRKFVLGFAIGIVFTLFIFYGIRTFYPEPDWNRTCGAFQPYPAPLKEPSAVNQSKCDALYGTFDSLKCEPQYRASSYNNSLNCYVPVCNTCQMQFDKDRERYDSNVFIISIVAGGLALIVGVIIG
ncbi:MAG: hypothetical protein EPN86_04865, partial [Nanoarchaeota archaeon]